MNQDNQWGLICKYLSGECTSDESEQLKLWLSKDPANRNLLDEMQKIWQTSNFLRSDSDYTNMDLEYEWSRMQSKISSNKQTPELVRSKYLSTHIRSNRKKSASYLWQISRIAALILIMLGGSILISLYLGPFYQDHSSAEPQFREIITQPRQLAGITLTDGSKVNLSVESKVRISETFNRDLRKVYLEGQAYFDVTYDRNLPFVVETNHTSLEVIGTDFSVRAYPDDEEVQVVVASGLVSLGSVQFPENPNVNISAGEIGTMDIVTGEIKVNQIDTSDYLGWLDGRLVFNDAQLSSVARDLERWFEVEFHIKDENLESRRLTAVLNNRSLLNVLDVLSLTMGVQYKLEDDDKKIFIYDNL